MTFRVTTGRVAEEALTEIVTWMAKQSSVGVDRLLDAYDNLLVQLY